MRKLAVAVIAMTLLSGCAAVVVGGAAGAAAGYVYVNGTLKDTLDVPLPRAEKASEAAMAEMDLIAVEATVDKLEARLTARMADGTKVRVKLKAVDFGTTTIHVRVGLFGDKAISQQVLRYIRRELDLEQR
jgi:hypothetical protein